MSDIEIAKNHKLLPIEEIASKASIDLKYIEKYGNHKAKISLDVLNETNNDSKLILVTSTNPTPYGEGKTTMSIGLNDALCKIGKKSIVTLREPSLGPVFGIKGGATGGGYAQVVPMEDINLHFTGDFHAITSANNLLSSVIDNHIFSGNELLIDPNKVYFRRCLDLNDRALRNVEVALGKNETPRLEKFQITAASEIMATLCLASDLEDLKTKISRILVGYSFDDKPVYVSDLGCEDSMTILLKDAIKPNLVSTLEDNPAIIHGGPFANIAHGCNSIIATKMALNLADYVVTEAGFGSDLGAEKFLDIKCRVANLKPDCIVINTTVRSLKYNSMCSLEILDEPSITSVKEGICNLEVHVRNMLKYTDNVIVCINRFSTDTEEEIDYINKFCLELGVKCTSSFAYSKGSDGALDLANAVIETTDNKSEFKFLYDLEDSIINKIEKLAKEIYHANGVDYSPEAIKSIDNITNLGFSNYPICVAKTQYSMSDDPKKLGSPTNYNVHVTDVKVSNGAGFIVVYMGSIMTMPGLSKTPALLKMSIDSDGNMNGLF